MKRGSIFETDGIPRIQEALPLALQHVVAMIVGCVTPAIIVAGAAGLENKDQVILIQAALVVAALSTLLQLFPIGKKYRIGSGLPIMAVQHQIVGQADVTVFLDIRHPIAAVRFIKGVFEVKIRAVLGLHDRIINPGAGNGNPSHQVAVLGVHLRILFKRSYFLRKAGSSPPA